MKAKGKPVTAEEEKTLLDKIKGSYEKQTTAYYAAARLWVDAVIDPADTRRLISEGIAAAAEADAGTHLQVFRDSRFTAHRDRLITLVRRTADTERQGLARIDTRNHPSLSVPFNWAETTLVLTPDGDGTLATFDYRYVPRGGPLGRLTGPLIDTMLRSTFTDMLAAAEQAAAGTSPDR